MKRVFERLIAIAGAAAILGAGTLLEAEKVDRADPVLKAELVRIVRQYELPGMVAAVVQDGRVQRIAAAGVRKIGAPNPITTDDKIHLGSCTKAMTATLVGMLVEEGKLSWDSTLPEMLPELKDDMHEAYRAVTLRQLLTHRSSLPANSARMFVVNSKASTTDQRLELFKKLLTKEPKYEPGSKYMYSNLGYMLAGLIAEVAAGDSWEALMQERLFKPLQMKSAGFGVPGTPNEIDQPWGHRKLPLLGVRAVQGDNPPVLGPAGTVHAAIDDWSKFVALHLKHQPNPPMMKEETIDELHRLQPGEDYALGWRSVPRPWAQGNALAHSGSNTMWMAVVWMSPQRDLAFLSATNSGQEGAAQACDDAISYLLRNLKP